MRKAQTIYVCNECGSESQKWLGQCPVCGAWNSFFEQKLSCEPVNDGRRRGGEKRPVPEKLSELKASTAGRIDTHMKELNRVLGGGLLPGSLTLITGEPGIGKSTLIIQAAGNIAKNGAVLYVSGEESEAQIKLRAERVCRNTEGIFVLSETDLGSMLNAAADMKPQLLIIDSIQTMYSAELDSAPGSSSQLRQIANLLMNFAKTTGIPVFMVAHVTKSGELAGPKLVEHIVDTVLEFTGERTGDLRILRALKNRFGTSSEIGAFEMREEGLTEIENLSGIFLGSMSDAAEGSVASAVYEGTRPLLLEIQALTSQTAAGFPMRRSVGIDSNRLSMIIAVLEKKAGINLYGSDVYVNVVGGFRPQGTSTDLAVAIAIWSESRGMSVPKNLLAIGEIGLTGELRPVPHCEKLLKEAERLGFKEVLLPKKNAERLRGKSSLRISAIGNIKEALK